MTTSIPAADESCTRRIAELNDAFRRTFQGGQVFVSYGIRALSETEQRHILAKVQYAERFDENNDPYGEHDFGSFDHWHEGRRYGVCWKLDYYNPTLTEASEDPADPDKTVRVLTILLAEEW